jgi:hypothetical protein
MRQPQGAYPLTRRAAPLISVITAADTGSRHWLTSPERLLVYYYQVAGALWTLKQAQGWHFG